MNGVNEKKPQAKIKIPDPSGVPSIDALANQSSVPLADYINAASQYVMQSPNLDEKQAKRAQIRLGSALARPWQRLLASAEFHGENHADHESDDARARHTGTRLAWRGRVTTEDAATCCEDRILGGVAPIVVTDGRRTPASMPKKAVMTRDDP